MTEEEIWNENKYLIKKMTNLLHFKWREFLDRSDIEDEVSFCLFKAIRSYNVEKSQGKTFTNWAIKIIHQRVHVKAQKTIRDLEANFQHQELASNAWKVPELHKVIKEVKDRPIKNASSRQRASNRRDEYLRDKKCIKCKSKKDLRIIHSKGIRIPSLWGLCQERREQHLSECVVMCKGCRMEQRFPGRKKRIALKSGKAKHGSMSTYTHYGCRCKECVDARYQYYLIERERKKK